jgi:hypothetical protein
MNNLEELVIAFPLGSDIGELEVFEERILIEGLELYLVALRAGTADLGALTASAAAFGGFDYVKAYQILHERVAAERTWRLEEHADWRLAPADGVALETDFDLAFERAKRKLLARDAVLKSWFGGQRPLGMVRGAWDAPTELVPLYHFDTFELQCFSEWTAAIVVGWPRNAKRDPLIFGYGAGRKTREAVQEAGGEALQRLGFLWGEDLPKSEPAFAPTSSYHLEMYLCPAGIKRFEDWLGGKHEVVGQSLTKSPSFAAEDITPAHLKGRLTIVRAHSAAIMPLAFGFCPHYGLPKNSARLIHPVI